MYFDLHIRLFSEFVFSFFFFFQAEDGIRDAQESRGLGDVYKRQYQRRVRDSGPSMSDQGSLKELILQARVVFSNLARASTLMESYFRKHGPRARGKKRPAPQLFEERVKKELKRLHQEKPDISPEECLEQATELVSLVGDDANQPGDNDEDQSEDELDGPLDDPAIEDVDEGAQPEEGGEPAEPAVPAEEFQPQDLS
eukprot:TRINITY_DN44054_c0_g1_i1.p1 TRINITY_DN44054_c0_g1~~TRINITY_DN44054_c0_g1_i1.p1  ORF type:complete len:198 (-),score=64.75 TRINITY_DN44054_c0_g1_i1:517-1110(-)